MNWLPLLGFFCWLCGGWAIARFIDPAAVQLYLIFTAFALIIRNLGERRGGRSAYSVFNENCQPLLGQIQAEQFDNEVRHRTTDESVSRPRRRHEESEHNSLLESTRREIFAEQRKARRTAGIMERPRRRR